jgi:uncharacterized RDD family membrane protein YckC
MTLDRTPIRYYPKVSIERRIYAFLIDFVVVWLLSSFIGDWLIRTIIFLLLWWVARVIAAQKNHGQSLGHWSMDIKVIDPRFDRTPGMVELSKREVILGLAALLAMWGLEIGLANGLSMILLLSPLIADGGVALADPEFYQAFHDRIAGTMAITTKRGYSLDLRLRKLWLDTKRRLRDRQK